MKDYLYNAALLAAIVAVLALSIDRLAYAGQCPEPLPGPSSKSLSIEERAARIGMPVEEYAERVRLMAELREELKRRCREALLWQRLEEAQRQADIARYWRSHGAGTAPYTSIEQEIRQEWRDDELRRDLAFDRQMERMLDSPILPRDGNYLDW